jgi:hypothetical protein
MGGTSSANLMRPIAVSCAVSEFGERSLSGLQTLRNIESHQSFTFTVAKSAHLLSAKLTKVRSAKLASTTMSPATRMYH